MSERFQPGHYYHLYNRGVNRGPIFFCQENWAFFIRRMRDYFKPDLVQIVAYALMPTHYHILVLSHTNKLSEHVMQPFATSYVKAVNRQQNRVGPLFQGPFRSKIVDNDAYLSHLTRYIHLNPVAAGYVGSPGEWPYSSYRDYIGLRNGTLAHSDVVLQRFPTRTDYQTFVESKIDERNVAFERWLREALEREEMR